MEIGDPWTIYQHNEHTALENTDMNAGRPNDHQQTDREARPTKVYPEQHQSTYEYGWVAGAVAKLT